MRFILKIHLVIPCLTSSHDPEFSIRKVTEYQLKYYPSRSIVQLFTQCERDGLQSPNNATENGFLNIVISYFARIPFNIFVGSN